MSSLRVLAAGRDADVFDLEDGTVLRRYRGHDVPSHEIEVMRYARASGFPVPEILRVDGADMILRRVMGPTMQELLLSDPTAGQRIAGELADLHHRLHRIPAPSWLRARGDGDRLLHLDLHPGNVILGPDGPAVIDWANAAQGAAALDPALTITIFVSARATARHPERAALDRFIQEFASHFAEDEVRAALPLAIALRSADTNVTASERAELAALERWPAP